MSLWLAIARAEATDETVAVRIAAVLSLTSAVDARFAAAGVAGMAGALDLHRQLAAVLAAVDAERVTALQRLVATLEGDVQHAAQALGRLRELKEALERPGNDPRPRSGGAR